MEKYWKILCQICLVSITMIFLTACGKSTEKDVRLVPEKLKPSPTDSLIHLYADTDGTQVSGSGFIVQIEDGKIYICTNKHVLDYADEWTVSFSNGTQAAGQTIGCSSVYDVGVISVSCEDIDSQTMEKLSPVNVDLNNWNAMSNGETECGGIMIYRMSTEGYSGNCIEGTVTGFMEPFEYGNGLNHTKMDISLEPGDSGSAVFDENGSLLAMVVGEIYNNEGNPSRWAVPLPSLITSYKEITGKEWVSLF